MRDYHFMWEEMRDAIPFTKGYMKIKNVIMGIENAFMEYEKEMEE